MFAEKKISNRTSGKVEIIHRDRYDVVLTTDSNLTQTARQVYELVKDGLPENWISYRHYEERERDNLRIDSLDSTQYFAKYRVNMRRNTTSIDPLLRRQDRSADSILCEFCLAPLVSHILKTKPVMRLANKYDIERIEFIPPLVGLIDHETGDKIVVYNWVEGHTPLLDLVPEEDNIFIRHLPWPKSDEFANSLDEIITQAGVTTYDFGDHNMMLREDSGGNKILYLFDIEGFIAT